MTKQEAFDVQCGELAKAIQTYIDTPPSEEREAVLLKMRALGMNPAHIARFLTVVGEIEDSIRRASGPTLH